MLPPVESLAEACVDTEDVKQRVQQALDAFIEHDVELLEFAASERSISHKFAEHLQKKFPEWKVDCEYNRRGTDPKTQKSGVKEARTVFPDVIVHKRGTEENCLVIEVKKLKNLRGTRDIEKLKAFTSKEYRYRLGLFLVFDMKSRKPWPLRWFAGGEELPSAS